MSEPQKQQESCPICRNTTGTFDFDFIASEMCEFHRDCLFLEPALVSTILPTPADAVKGAQKNIEYAIYHLDVDNPPNNTQLARFLLGVANELVEKAAFLLKGA